jgi:hypothetical protein
MSIELIQTMQWTKLCWEVSFESILELDNVLPKIGEVYPIKIREYSEDYLVKEGKAFVLWQPPHSELNGWYDKRPSEILKSYVLDGLIKNIGSNRLEFDFEINDRIRLIDFFGTVDLDETSPLSRIGLENGTSFIQWSDARDLLKAKVGDYWYFSGNECETSLELIFSYIGDRICIHYSTTSHNSASYETKVTNYFLNEFEHIVISKLLEKATEVLEESKWTLQENQVYGAEYY